MNLNVVLKEHNNFYEFKGLLKLAKFAKEELHLLRLVCVIS